MIHEAESFKCENPFASRLLCFLALSCVLYQTFGDPVTGFFSLVIEWNVGEWDKIFSFSQFAIVVEILISSLSRARKRWKEWIAPSCAQGVFFVPLCLMPSTCDQLLLSKALSWIDQVAPKPHKRSPCSLFNKKCDCFPNPIMFFAKYT